MAMLKVEDLSVNYGYITALTKASIEVEKGEIVTLIGSNGAGKTTMLMSVSNVIQKSSGKVSFKDEDITRKASHKIVKSGICHVPEGRKIFPALSVYENLWLGTVGHGDYNRKKLQELVERQYDIFPRLKERRNQAGGSLSGGEQQMLAIARGLMMEPELIMLDEPSLGLAPIVVEEIFELILKIQKSGKTVLLIEQNAAMALSIANRGYVLQNGRIVLQGRGIDLLHNEEVKRLYLGADE
ncbi:MAG: ABC transporter ATP-binding protein [Lachnospiraceae bacterium]|nr:ABC transporter ATP-binding protein [Lachnospiraceae bacterium]